MFDKLPISVGNGCDPSEHGKFCGVMDLPTPVHKSSYNIYKAAKSVQESSMLEIAKLEYSQATPVSDMCLQNASVS